jgi:hypothetical protein
MFSDYGAPHPLPVELVPGEPGPPQSFYVKTHDPRVVPPVLLHDVELVVDYRDHRHAPRREEWWQDPRQR